VELLSQVATAYCTAGKLEFHWRIFSPDEADCHFTGNLFVLIFSFCETKTSKKEYCCDASSSAKGDMAPSCLCGGFKKDNIVRSEGNQGQGVLSRLAGGAY